MKKYNEEMVGIIQKIFPVILAQVGNGMTIIKALRDNHVSSAMFYKCITGTQKTELKIKKCLIVKYPRSNMGLGQDTLKTVSDYYTEDNSY